MHPKWVISLTVLLTAVGLSACGGPPPPTCDASDLVAPNLSMPADGGLLELGENLDWGYPVSPCEPGGYNLQVNTASDFSGTEVGEFVPPPHSWWWPPTPLEQGTTYYWRVQAVLDGDVGPWSPTWSFNTSPACALVDLVAPNLMMPADGGLLELGQNLDWGYPASPCEPGGYNLQVNTASDFSGTEVGGFVPPPHSWWWPQTPLEQGTTYYWRVQAVLDGDAGPWSPTWSFNTKPACTLGVLVAPTQIFPDDYAEITYPLPSIVWDYSDPTCDPLGYHLQIANDPGFDFTSIAYERRSPDPTTSDSVAGTTLSDCDTYYWRVAAYDGTTDGPFSPTRRFHLNLSGTCIGPPQASPLLETLRDWPCYQGPSFEAAIQGYFLTGDVAPLIAQDLMGDWWVIENPDAVGESCWVPQEGTVPSGDIEGLQRWAAPEPSLMCTRDLDRATCEAAGGTYVEGSRVANDDYCQCP